MSREDHNGNQRVATPDPGENGQAAEPRHDEVEKDPLNGSGLQYPQALGAIERDERLVTEGADRLAIISATDGSSSTTSMRMGLAG